MTAIGTSALTPEQSEENLQRFGFRYSHIASGESAYQHFRPLRKFGRGRMAVPKTRRRK